ncbi:MAG: DUF815 domain-containing protein, partial [Hyphomicrobiaceae bacterium]
MTDLSLSQNTDVLERIAAALERIAPPADPAPDYNRAEGFIWQPRPPTFQPIGQINRIPLGLLKGLDRTAEQLLDNTRRFAEGFPANNALLW